MRDTSAASISLNVATGCERASDWKRLFLPPPVSATLSMSVFHAPQCGHLPSHFGEVPPHSLHEKIVLSLAMRGIVTG